MHPDKRFMQLAIDGVRNHFHQETGGPFGACIVCDDKVVATGHNTVLLERDPTCHAEINAIRVASRALNTFDLSHCTIYSTTEPCPMCFSAIHWARIPTIIFGSRIPDVQALGFNELDIPCSTMKAQGHSPVTLVNDFMRNECLQLLVDWQRHTNGKTY